MSRRAATERGGVTGTALALLLAGCGGDSPTRPVDFESPGPGVALDLAPGERVTFDASEMRGGLEIAGASESRSYLFIVHDARGEAGGAVDLRFSTSRIPSPFAQSGAPAAGTSAGPGGLASRANGPDDPFAHWLDAGEARFRARVNDDLARAGARPAADRGVGRGLHASVAASVPAVGQLLDFGSPVEADGGLATCTSTSSVAGRVRAVGPRFAIVEDTLVAGHLSASDYATILDEIETVAFPVDSAYFGVPLDLDGNGRVIALVTGEVNRLGAAGFFTSSDLASAEDCPTSNEGEVLWLIAPDPQRQHGTDPIPTDLVRTRIAGVVVHELQHLIHLQRRVFEGGGDLSSADLPWMNEGLSHIAEEVAGFFAAGRRTGTNYGLEDLGSAVSRARFARYHLNDFRFMREYFEDTTGVPVLVDGQVTRGELQKARGFGYLFLRWLADRFAAGGAPGLVGSVSEEALFRDLTLGGTGLERSVDNVVAALSGLGVDRTWEELFETYVGAPAVDDVAAEGIDFGADLDVTSWNFPLAYQNASENGFELDFPVGFPLLPRLILLGTIPVDGFSEDFELLPSSAAYFRLEGVFETPLSLVSVAGAGGAPLPLGNRIRVTVIRTL